jgi:hypothetical protein
MHQRRSKPFARGSSSFPQTKVRNDETFAIDNRRQGAFKILAKKFQTKAQNLKHYREEGNNKGNTPASTLDRKKLQIQMSMLHSSKIHSSPLRFVEPWNL